MGKTASEEGQATRSTEERRMRYEPSAIYHLADSLRRQGIDLATRSGPWRAVARALQRPGRNRLPVVPIVTNGLAQVMVDTMEHARDVAVVARQLHAHVVDATGNLPARAEEAHLLVRMVHEPARGVCDVVAEIGVARAWIARELHVG